MKPEMFDHMLSTMNIHPVLVDIGSSGAPLETWDSIARHSIYIGFDPDLRDLREISDGRFHRSITVNKAVTNDTQSQDVTFYFTSSPYCSSTLLPDTDGLSDYLFADLFTVTGQAKVQATTLNNVLDQLQLPGIDWFKTDSQGTDLRLFNSLRDEIRSHVLAVQIEPGLIDAYQEEDLFVDAHKNLVKQGFWLSNIEVRGTVRMQQSTLKYILANHKDINYGIISKHIRDTPGWCEAVYLRTIDWLIHNNATKREFALLWIFALIDGQVGFALDLGIEYEKQFGNDNIARMMKQEPITYLQQCRDMELRTKIETLPKRIIRLAKSGELPTRIKQRLSTLWNKKSV